MLFARLTSRNLLPPRRLLSKGREWELDPIAAFHRKTVGLSAGRRAGGASPRRLPLFVGYDN